MNVRKIKKEDYEKLLNQKRLTPKERDILSNELFINYCKCIKKLKYSKDHEPGNEYPICMSSIYSKRGITPPKNASRLCKETYY